MTPQERKEKVLKLKEEHQEYFDSIGESNAQFIPKMAYRPVGKDDLYVSFFPSELEKSEDIYTEFVSIEYDSEDPKRTLYKHKFNPHWKEEYEMITSSTGYERHIIPVNELKIINDVTSRKKTEEAIKEIVDFGLMNPDEDAPLNKLTIKDIAALWLKQPVSDKEWLNKLIKNAK